jgi:predicted secreted protein
MEWTSIIAIFSLFWVLSAFLVMPFGMRTVEEEGVAGQVDSAPAHFRPGRRLRATIPRSYCLPVLAIMCTAGSELKPLACSAGHPQLRDNPYLRRRSIAWASAT